MKFINYFLPVCVGAFIACDPTDVYDSSKEKVEVPQEDFFDFQLRSEINLSINYGIKGYKTIIEVYEENPMCYDADGVLYKNADVNAIYKAFTDENCIYQGKMNLPSRISKVYIYTPLLGLPTCVEVDVEDGKVVFDMSQIETRATISTPTTSTAPYLLEASKKLYSLTKWENYGKLNDNNFKVNYPVFDATLLSRLQNILWNGKTSKPGNLDNTHLLVDEQFTNISIATKMLENGVTIPVEGATIQLTFLAESGNYMNSLGYYYYPTGSNPDVAELNKYLIFPNVSVAGSYPFTYSREQNRVGRHATSNAPLKSGATVDLYYIDENGNRSNTFPAGYTIGWFLISDGFTDASIPKNLNTSNDFLYSNVSFNKDGKARCISMYDSKSEKIVVGFEDGGDKSCEDILFYVTANPMGAIVDPNKPTIDDDDVVLLPEIEPEKSIGTLAFEDIWPYGGDYDMNDVVITYDRNVYFDNNNFVTKITTRYSNYHNGAKIISAFGVQLPKCISYDMIESQTINGEILNWENNQSFPTYIIYKNCNEDKNDYEIEINLKEGIIKKDILSTSNFNPFIIPEYSNNEDLRTEVHLPKMDITDLGIDHNGSSGNYYFIGTIDGRQYPFAIDIPIHNFKVSPECIRINETYLYFDKWVSGEGYEDWYMK